MPAFAASAFPSDQRTINIRVFPKGTNQLWLLEQDVPWLVEYVAQEVACGGVPLEVSTAAVAAPNCAAAGVHIRWDFQSGGAWEALFVDGPRKGLKIRSRICSLTAERWNLVRSNISGEKLFEDATPEERKKAVWHFLELHCMELDESTPA